MDVYLLEHSKFNGWVTIHGELNFKGIMCGPIFLDGLLLTLDLAMLTTISIYFFDFLNLQKLIRQGVKMVSSVSVSIIS